MYYNTSREDSKSGTTFKFAQSVNLEMFCESFFTHGSYDDSLVSLVQHLQVIRTCAGLPELTTSYLVIDSCDCMYGTSMLIKL